MNSGRGTIYTAPTTIQTHDGSNDFRTLAEDLPVQRQVHGACLSVHSDVYMYGVWRSAQHSRLHHLYSPSA